MTPIKYIGARPTYREGAYGSGLIFEQGQTLNVKDDELARKLLRHKDVYVRGKAKDGDVAEIQAKKSDADSEDDLQDARDLINVMDAPALKSYAMTHFSVSIDARKGVESLRSQVTGLVDQFGLK